MIPDFMYDLKNEKLYYEISNKLTELYELEKEEKAKLINKLSSPPVLHTYRPSLAQINEYSIQLSKYHKELEEYKSIKSKLDNNKSWQELINTYVFECYGQSLTPIGLVEKFIFNKYKHQKYEDIFENYIEMLDWFDSNNVYASEDLLSIEQVLSKISITTRKDYSPAIQYHVSRIFVEVHKMQDILEKDYKTMNK